MRRTHSAKTVLVVISGMLGLSACEFDRGKDEISLAVTDDGRHLRIDYQLSRSTEAIVFARTPDETRLKRWQILPPGFAFTQLDGKDVIYRPDGVQFSSVEVLVPATYIPLPKDYAPFSPFSDGGLLIHSGRFQACPSSVETVGENCAGPWSMRIQVPTSAHILLNGERYDEQTHWSDVGDGTKIYVGGAELEPAMDFVGVVDPALPPEISDLLSTALPELMKFYGRRLPELTRRPMLFVSYDPSYDNGYGNQGGVLSNQVFMHFYGPTWKKIDPEGRVPEDIAWFFAHEAGHIYQLGVTGDRQSSWIHEGSAEAFAYLALKDLETVSTAYLDLRRDRAQDACGDALKSGALVTAADRGSFSDYYDCGLTIFIAIDEKIRASSHNQQDLFDLWSKLIPDLRDLDALDSETFLKKVEPWIGDELAQQLLSISTEVQVDPHRALAQLWR